MTNPVQIDQLPSANVPLTGAEIIAGVQGGITSQMTVANIANVAQLASLTYTLAGNSFSATAGRTYGVVTASLAITATLPAASVAFAAGLMNRLMDVSNNAGTNNITITANGSDTIILAGSSGSSKIIATNSAVVTLVPISSTQWRMLVK